MTTELSFISSGELFIMGTSAEEILIKIEKDKSVLQLTLSNSGSEKAI